MVIKWGIMSTANIGVKAVLPAINAVENAEISAIASRNPKVNEIAKEFNIPSVYATYDELLDDPSIQAVYIPLPNALHKEWVLKAAEKGKHVLCEKPAALTSSDIQDMINACRLNGVYFMEAFMYQFQPQHARVKEIISSGEIGEVRQFRSTFSFKLDTEKHRDNIRLNTDLGGGSLWDVGCYCVHSARFILEQEPVEVFAQAFIHPEFGVDTKANGILTFKDGVTATFDCSFEQPMEEKYEVAGTKGSIRVPFAYRSDMRGTNGLGEIYIVNEKGEERREVFEGNQYELQVKHFSDCIVNNQSPSYTPTQTKQNIEAIEACYKSIHSKEVIMLG